MNEVTTENTDRFYKPLGEMSGSERIEHEEKTNTSFEKPKEYTMLKYAPEPLHMNESKVKHLQFTIGNKYPVIEKRHEYSGYKTAFGSMETAIAAIRAGANYSFKTINDKEETVWVDEKYFIPANINLMHEVAVGGFMPKKDNLDWDATAEDGIIDLCDIRKMASEKNVKPLEVLDDGLKENLTLSRLAEQIIVDKTSDATSHLRDGVVKDTGNDLMNNATKCMAAIDKVFGTNKIADPDGIITAIRLNVPHLCLQWENDFLCVNGAQTKITYSEVQAAYSGLKGLVSAKIAQRTVGKLVASQLKKVF